MGVIMVVQMMVKQQVQLKRRLTGVTKCYHRPPTPCFKMLKEERKSLYFCAHAIYACWFNIKMSIDSHFSIYIWHEELRAFCFPEFSLHVGKLAFLWPCYKMNIPTKLFHRHWNDHCSSACHALI